MKLSRNFSILTWLSCLYKDLKQKNLKLKDLFQYSTSLFRVIFMRYKYIGINTKWCTEWYWIKGGENYE